MTPVERLIATARAEIGYLEKANNAQLDDKTTNAGANNYTKYARDLDRMGVYNGAKNGYAWCDVFVDWVFIQTFGLELAMQLTCQPMGGYGAGCTESARYYKQAGRFFKSGPQPGDQIFFSSNGGSTMYHTGLVTAVTGSTITTIEGNTSSAAGVVANGGAVREKQYSINYNQIGGYGRPDYSIVPEEDEDMDVNRFRELWLEMRKQLQDNDNSSYSAEAREWAIANDIIEGSGTLPDGSPNYMWEDVPTREQLITVIFRVAQLMGKA